MANWPALNRAELDALTADYDEALIQSLASLHRDVDLEARRRQLAAAYAAAAAETGDPQDVYLAETYASGQLDHPTPARRVVATRLYLANRQFMSYPRRGRQALDDAVQSCRQILDSPEARQGDMLDLRAETVILLACTLIVRYQRVYEQQLLPDLSPEASAHIEADIRSAVEVLSTLRAPHSQSIDALTALGTALSLQAEIAHDPAKRGQALTALRQAVAVSHSDSTPPKWGTDDLSRIAAADRLASALTSTEVLAEAMEAVEVLERLRRDTHPDSIYHHGMLLSLASARTRTWMISQDEGLVPTVRRAYLDALSASVNVLPFTAFTVTTQWAGWATLRGAMDEAAVAYAAAIFMLRGLVGGETSRDQQEEVVRSLPGVAVEAAAGLARSGLVGEAVRCLEFGRAVLLANALDIASSEENTRSS